MKNLKKLGKVLSTKEQKNVNGGYPDPECGRYVGMHQCGSLCCMDEPYTVPTI